MKFHAYCTTEKNKIILNVNLILILIDFALARVGAGWRWLARVGASWRRLALWERSNM